jgi:uncharacterized protein (DUF1800 family)
MPATDILGADDAAHLLRRAAFGATAKDLTRFATLTRQAAVDRLLGTKTRRSKPPGKKNDLKSFRAAQAWWLKQMIHPKWRLHEKVALFWHAHFPSGWDDVPSVSRLCQQNRVFRQHGLGSFRVLLYEITRDPAMLVAFDGQNNRADRPNENYARALLEDFTLGVRDAIGVETYTQTDVAELARALTGFVLREGSLTASVENGAFDDGSKTLFASNVAETTGLLGVEDGAGAELPAARNVLDILFLHRDSEMRPTLARFLTRKLWEFFAYPDPAPALVDALADDFVASGYQVRALVAAILLHDDFYSPEARTSTAKTPLDFALQTLQTLRAKPNYAALVDDLSRMGLALLNPPSIGGWPTGEGWLSAGYLQARLAFAQSVAAGRSKTTYVFKPKPFVDKNATTSAAVVDGLLADLGVQPSATARQVLIDYYEDSAAVPAPERLETQYRGLFVLMLSLPEFQVH